MWARKFSRIRQLANQLINETSIRLIGQWTCSISVGEVIIQYTRRPMGTSFNQADSQLLKASRHAHQSRYCLYGPGVGTAGNWYSLFTQSTFIFHAFFTTCLVQINHKDNKSTFILSCNPCSCC